MRTRMWLGIIALVAAPAVGAANEPITKNPIPEPIVKRGIAVELKDLARLPDTRGLRPPDQDVSPAVLGARELRARSARRPPLRQRLARAAVSDRCEQSAALYADVGATFPLSVYSRLSSGFIGFAFHPEFATNGLWYTVHGENAPGNPKTPDFTPLGYASKDVTYHNVITEWHATNPAANTFDGTRRELFRVAHIVQT